MNAAATLQSFTSDKNSGQLFFLGVASLFLLYMLSTAALRSSSRQSILSTTNTDTDSFAAFAELGTPGERGTKLHLKDFHRVEVRNGRPVWEISAEEANHFAKDSIAHVNKAAVKIYRSNDSDVEIKALRARLEMNESQVSKANLEQDVLVTFENSLKVKTDHAIYDAVERKIRAPEFAVIEGQGFEVSGMGFEIEIDRQIIQIAQNVSSRFEPEAKLPKGMKLKGLLK